VKSAQIRRIGLAGEELAVEVRCDEGVATRIGPEPCVVGREGAKRRQGRRKRLKACVGPKFRTRLFAA
jgi:hypothetical protein